MRRLRVQLSLSLTHTACCLFHSKCALLRLLKCRFIYTFLLGQPATLWHSYPLSHSHFLSLALFPSLSRSLRAFCCCMLFWQLVKASRTLVKCKWNACIAMKCCPIIYGLYLPLALPLLSLSRFMHCILMANNGFVYKLQAPLLKVGQEQLAN